MGEKKFSRKKSTESFLFENFPENFPKNYKPIARRQKFSRKMWRLRSRYWLVFLCRWMSVNVVGPRANCFVCWGFFFLSIVHEWLGWAREFACNSWIVLLSCCFFMYFFFFLFTNWGRHGGLIFKFIVFVLFVTLSSPPTPPKGGGGGSGKEEVK